MGDYVGTEKMVYIVGGLYAGVSAALSFLPTTLALFARSNGILPVYHITENKDLLASALVIGSALTIPFSLRIINHIDSNKIGKKISYFALSLPGIIAVITGLNNKTCFIIAGSTFLALPSGILINALYRASLASLRYKLRGY